MSYRAAFGGPGYAVSSLIESLEDRRLLSATIVLENLDAVPADNRLVFNRIQNLNPQVTDIVHDTDVLRIHNTGDQALVINSLVLSDTTDWQLVNAPAKGTKVVAGGSLDLTVKFIAQAPPVGNSVNETNDVVATDGTPPLQGGGVYNGMLTINSNDPAQSASVVQLAGYWQKNSEHEEEPSLQTITNLLFGYTTQIATTTMPDYPNNGSTVVTYGDEVLSSYWKAADPSQAVTVRQLAAYHSQQDPNDASNILSEAFSWFAQGSPGTIHTLFKHALREGNSVLPHILNSSTSPAEGSFQTNGTFGFDVDGEFSQDSLNTTDINTFGRSGHAVRFFPARDSSGNLIANSWIVAMDYQNSSFDNGDYQDGVYLVTNMHPVNEAPAPTNLQATTSAGAVTVQWSAVTDSTLQGYNIYRSSSQNGTFTQLNGTPVNATSFVDSSPLNGAAFYRVSAVDTGGESQKSDVSVGTPAAEGGADLIIGSVKGKFPSKVVGGSKAGATRVTLTNNGGQTAKGTVEIDLFASSTQNSVAGDATALTHITRRINLKPTKSVSFALPGFKYPSAINDQSFIVVQVKTVSGITESTSANNTGAFATAVTIAAPFVDLQNLYTGATPASLTVGKREVLVLPVTNEGNITAKGTATVTLTASTTGSAAGGTTLATVPTHVTIAPDSSRNIKVRFLVPQLASGSYFIVTNVSLATDTQSANNVAKSTSTFQV